MSADPDWVDMQGFNFEIPGKCGSSLHFRSDSVLAKRVVFTGVISFNVHLSICTPGSTIRHDCQFADYNGIRPFQDSLRKIRRGDDLKAGLGGAGFSMDMGKFKFASGKAY
jgi:hypothetical protein